MALGWGKVQHENAAKDAGAKIEAEVSPRAA
jgi:hypothetical protein